MITTNLRVILAAGVVVALVGACAQSVGTTPTDTPGPESTSALISPPPVDHLALGGFPRLAMVDESVVVIADQGLLRLTSGRAVAALAKPDDDPIESRPVALADGDWAIATSGGADLAVYTSTDQGGTWLKRSRVAIGSARGIAALQVASRGGVLVVLATEASGTNVSLGVTASSSDGGTTWKTARAPSGGWLGASDGTFVLVGGPMGDEVFRSTDGLAWTAIDLPVSARYWTAGSPVAIASGIVIPVTTHNGDDASQVLLLMSKDDGSSWAAAGEVSAPSTAFSTVIPSAIAPDGRWAIAYVDGSKVVSGVIGKATSTTRSPNGLPTNVQDLAWAGGQLVALAAPSSCPSGKDSCAFTSVLAASDDGGQTWDLVK